MKAYDTLVIGSGYTSLGYALTRGNTLICEESESGDAQFYLPLKCYRGEEYAPTTELGQALLSQYESLSLFDGGMQNCNGFECGFCAFALEHGADILLKARVVHKEATADGLYDVTLITNSGLEHILTKRVLDMRGGGTRYFTLLFLTENKEDVDAIAAAFPTANVEPAFYGGRYALHVPAPTGVDYNGMLMQVCDGFSNASHTASVLFIAPRLSVVSEVPTEIPCDADFTNPIAAFEAGVAYAGRCR